MGKGNEKGNGKIFLGTQAFLEWSADTLVCEGACGRGGTRKHTEHAEYTSCYGREVSARGAVVF
ncbi:MAG: hypothetical protein D6679_10215 [Candidatus Hydrogenedentota bacterium]|nr:MAG: hypothetical protein D6679_10215 [Candidatus Hydrogenedentota bacterium]